MRAAKRSWISVAENFPGYSVPDLKKIHKSEELEALFRKLKGGKRGSLASCSGFLPARNDSEHSVS
jgi:hypothetical protein